MLGPVQHAAWQRYELKYLVDEHLAARVRAVCERFMKLDPYSDSQSDREYPIHSVYFDSSDRVLAQSVVDRCSNRYKLRVRRYRGLYENAAELPTYFEVKRKNYGVVHKTRTRLTSQDSERLLETGFDSFYPPDAEPEIVERLSEFLRLRSRLRAQPVIAVFYTREAYENRDDGVRISFDRNLHYGVMDDDGERTRELWWPVPLSGIILEIKFTNTYPFWIRDLIGRSELARRGVCKYLICSQASRGIPFGRRELKLL